MIIIKLKLFRVHLCKKKQSIETLLNEESLLLAKYLRDEKKKWIPRLATLK